MHQLHMGPLQIQSVGQSILPPRQQFCCPSFQQLFVTHPLKAGPVSENSNSGMLFSTHLLVRWAYKKKSLFSCFCILHRSSHKHTVPMLCLGIGCVLATPLPSHSSQIFTEIANHHIYYTLIFFSFLFKVNRTPGGKKTVTWMQLDKSACPAINWSLS